MSKPHQLAEAVATVTTPAPVTVSGAIIMGISISEWIVLGTVILMIFQLIVMAPKAYATIKTLVDKIRSRYGRTKRNP